MKVIVKENGETTVAGSSAQKSLMARLGELTSTEEFRRDVIAVILSTILSGLAISRLKLWPLEWVMLVPILVVLQDKKYSWAAFRLGWVAGGLAHLVLFRWIIETIVRFSNLPAPLAMFTHILFAAGHGLLWAAWFGIASYVVRYARVSFSLAIPLAYIACAAWGPQLFPWWVGMTQHYLRPFAQIADIGGVALVSFVVVATNAAIAEAIRSWRQKESLLLKPAAVVAVAIVLSILYGSVRIGRIQAAMDDAPPVKAALLQPNVSYDLKRGWQDPMQRLQEIIDLMRQAKAQDASLMVIPESGLPFVLWGSVAGNHNISQQDIFMGLSLAKVTQELGVPLVAGSALSSPEGYYNSALFLVPAEGKEPSEAFPADLIRARYDKIGLLTFGERIPFADVFPILYEWIQGVGDFRPGKEPVSFEMLGLKMAAGICYEAIIGPLTWQALQDGENVLLNITNDEWFGGGDERYQHWTLALWRTIENRVWLLRDTNTGHSSVVDPLGREVASIPMNERGVLYADVKPIAEGGIYRSMGRWFEVLCGIALLAAVIYGSRRKAAHAGEAP